jgi:hypothetical protein
METSREVKNDPKLFKSPLDDETGWILFVPKKINRVLKELVVKCDA